MGERKLLAAAAALIFAGLPFIGLVTNGALVAQGPVYRERWGYLHLERLRATVADELAGRDAATRAKVADLLVQPDEGVPFAPAARALAMLRGVEADPAFLLRATVSVFLLPEVVDPYAQNELCRQLNATLFLPYTVAAPGRLAFDVRVHDRAGARVFAATVQDETTVDDLRRARPVANVPCGELADGTYELVVGTTIDDGKSRRTDPELRLPFHVLRGYQARSEAAMTATRELSPSLGALPQALLLGIAAEVSRAYQGEAFDGVSDAIVELQRLEAALDNVRQARHVLHGLLGDVSVGLPTGGDALRCVLRLGKENHPASSPVPRPLVVIAGGAPSLDASAHRPSAPGSLGPRWPATAMPRFGAGEPWHVAFLESPGLGRNYGEVLPAAMVALRELLATGEQPVLLVCEREAASIAGFSMARLQPQLAGLVLVGAGAMPAPAIDAVADLRVRLVALRGYPSSAGLQRVLDYADTKKAAGAWNGDLGWLVDEALPWPCSMQRLQEPLLQFARQLFISRPK